MRNIAAVLLALTVGACASAGSKFEWDNARRVSVGMTEADLVATMGSRPNAVSSAGATTRLSWVYSSASPLEVGSRYVTFALTNGVVSGVPDLTQLR